MSKPLAWVNVNDPKKFKDAEQQRLIQQHVGKNFRNRSKPMQRLQQEREQQRLEQQSDKHRDAASPKQFAPGYSSPSLASDFSGSLTHKLHREHVELRRLNDNQNSNGTVRLSASERMHTGPPSPPPPPPSPQERLLALVPDPNEVEDEVNGDEDFKDAWAYGVLTYLDQSRADPFATYPVDGSDRHISLLVDYGTSFLDAQVSSLIHFDSYSELLVDPVAERDLRRCQPGQQCLPHAYEEFTTCILHILSQHIYELRLRHGRQSSTKEIPVATCKTHSRSDAVGAKGHPRNARQSFC